MLTQQMFFFLNSGFFFFFFVLEYGMHECELGRYFSEPTCRRYFSLFLNEVTLRFCIRTAALDPNIVRKETEVIIYLVSQESIRCEPVGMCLSLIAVKS
jgi:hypothetical protein